MRRLLIGTTALSVALTSGPLPVAAQTVIDLGGQQVICLHDDGATCPDGAICVKVKKKKNCEMRAQQKLDKLAAGAAEEPVVPEADSEADPVTDAAAEAEKAAKQAAKEAERAAAEQAAAEQAAAEQAAADEAARVAAEQAAADEAARVAAEQAAADEAARVAAEQAAADEAARVEAEKAAADEAARVEAEKAAADEAARLEAKKAAADEAAQAEAEQAAADEAARAEAEKAAADEAARAEAEKAAADEAARVAAEQAAADEAARVAAEQAAADEAARVAAEQAAADEAARVKAEKAAADEAARAEAEKAAADEAAQAEAEQAAADESARVEAEKATLEEATQQLQVEEPVAEDIAPPADPGPVTEADLPKILETAAGVEAPGVEAVEALGDILVLAPDAAIDADTALPEAAMAEEAVQTEETMAVPEAEESTEETVVVPDADTATEEVVKVPRKKRKPKPVVIDVTEDDTRSSDEDFGGKVITTDSERDSKGKKKLSDLEKFGLVVLGALAVGAILKNGNQVVSNSGDRVVVRQPDGQYVVLKDDDTLLRQPGSNVQTETYEDGSTRSVVTYADGSRISTIRDASGRVLRRSRFDAAGREVMLIDDLAPVERVDVTTLPKPRDPVVIRGQDDELRAAMANLDARDLGRTFSLRQIREYPQVRAYAPLIDLEAVTFETGSAAIRATEAQKLRELGQLMAARVAADPSEVFLIEGHTDAVGSGAYNLALSDRRAESLALALTEYFGVPPENMVTQGYGETELLIDTQGDEALNRRVAVRIITPLLNRVATR